MITILLKRGLLKDIGSRVYMSDALCCSIQLGSASRPFDCAGARLDGRIELGVSINSRYGFVGKVSRKITRVFTVFYKNHTCFSCFSCFLCFSSYGLVLSCKAKFVRRTCVGLKTKVELDRRILGRAKDLKAS